MAKQFSAGEIRQAVVAEITTEERQRLIELFREQMDYATTADLVAGISDNLKEQEERNPEDAAEMAKWNKLDRILFMVREAFCIGQLSGLEMGNAAVAAQLTALEQGN